MDSVDVQQFITSHRAQLNQEKMRLQSDLRTSRGILPSGSQATEKAAMLRKERESEYNNFMNTKAPTRPAPGKSIAEIRRQMSRERDRELSTPVALPKEESREYDYSRLKEKKMAEERLYRNQGYKSHRARWDDSNPVVSFKEEIGHFDDHSDKRQSWDSEEKDLVSWARDQTNGRTRQTKATTPPPDTSPGRTGNHLNSHRSISAPTPPLVGGITSLGGGDSDMERKRNRQKEYAESLRAQMREKEAAKQKNDIKIENSHSPVLSKNAQRERPEIKTHKAMKSPRKDQRDLYLPYPPPPPQYPHYPPYPYMHPYYGPPPPGDIYHHHKPEGTSRPDPYRYTYYPHPPHDLGYTMNPYLPPHVPAHVPSSRHYDERSGREASTSRRDFKRSPRDAREERFESKEQGDRKSNQFTSPIHGDSDRPTKQNKASYRQELEKQMFEKKERDLKSKLERERYEQKKDVEIYDPFGKGGCGAPVRDQHGNLVADLKQMRKINEERLGTSPRESQEFANSDEPDVSVRKSLENKSSKSPVHTILKYDKVDDGTQKKVVQESYRDYLRKQVEEKEVLKRKEKEEQMKEEKRELERLENDRVKLKEDFKIEREKERQREEEARNKNEELKKEAEQKRRELTLKERERKYLLEQEARLIAEKQRLAFVEKMEQPVHSPQQQRSGSPPIPTLRKQQNQGRNLPSATLQSKEPTHQDREPPTASYQSSSSPVPNLRPKEQTSTFEQTTARSSSPPVPAVRKRIMKAEQNETRPTVQQIKIDPKMTEHTSNEKKSHERVHQPLYSADTIPSNSANVTTPTESSILSQLAALRMHLQSQLAEQQVKPPPPLDQKPKPRVTSGPRVRHQHTGAMLSTMEDFNSLKYKNPYQNHAFLNQFPDPPRSDSSLQVQQGALLRYQEEMLSKMRRRGSGGKENKPEINNDLLSSASVGIPLNSTDIFSESNAPPFLNVNSKPDPTHLPHPELTSHRPNIARNTSAGGRSQFSIATLDIDSMAIKNEERMRRLDAILNAGADTRSVRGVGGGGRDDSQTVLRNFMRRGERQSFTRGSEKSLDCETTYQRLSTPSS